MTRTLVIISMVLGLAAGARPARAQEAVAPAAAADGDRGGDNQDDRPNKCPPQVLAGLKAAVPNVIGTTTCTYHRGTIVIKDGASTGAKYTAWITVADGRTAAVEMTGDGQLLAMVYTHNDLYQSSDKGMAVLFWLFALISVGGAVFVITRKNLIAAVMGMVGSFLGIAAVYMLLYAQFLAVVQMLVYAGAIMVLFVFVVIILNRPEDEPVATTGRLGQAIGGISILYLIGRLVMMLIDVRVPVKALAAPTATAEGHDWGSVAAVGTNLFGPGLFPFEAISILLLVAVVGAIAIARPLHAEDDAPAKVRQEGVA
ncbi:MAG TPA: NADH-quinone oxidoreductase subunit J [Kofleriaceae bacterium]